MMGKHHLSPEGTLRKQWPMGSILILSILLWSEKGIWHFQNPHFQAAFLKSWKCFIPRRDSAKAETNGVHFDSFHFNCGLRRVFDTFKITTFRRPFWNPENVLSPGGTLRRAEPEGGPIVFTLDFIGVDYHTGIFKITTFRWHFWNLENVLFDGTDGLDGRVGRTGNKSVL